MKYTEILVGRLIMKYLDEMSKVNDDNNYSVSVAARIIYQLGEQLISDEFVALAELIKNGYDADCKLIDIKVDTKVETKYGRGRIVIKDTGNGMTKGILTKSFLRISSDFKKTNRYSPYFKRRTLGEKGLGRLSIQRLGTHLTLITSPRIERLKDIISEEDLNYTKIKNTYRLSINWNDFKEENGDISLIKAKIDDSFEESPELGTKLIIEGIRNPDFWILDNRTKTKIRTEIFGMTNLFEQKVAKKFKVKLKIDENDFSNEKINEDILDLMSDVKIKFEVKDLVLNLEVDQRKRYLERLSQKVIENMNILSIFNVKKVYICSPNPLNLIINEYKLRE